MQKKGFVYIMTNGYRKTVLYTGVTSNLLQRVYQHRMGVDPLHFTARYNVKSLVYYQEWPTILEAICEEKRIKAGSRAAKIALVESLNPRWDDLWEMDVGRWRM
ncbi:MAG: GIY-YIG nuclease family protein [Chitinophagaceae bacterium]|nr:MAG: GIY-YIG nuclease family protein [Chitinophagaceae bacterium]